MFFNLFEKNIFEKYFSLSLSVKYVRGKDPTLILYDDNDEEVDNLGIDKWTTDTVDEYLNQILLNQ